MIVRAWIEDGTLRCASQVCAEDCPRWDRCEYYETKFDGVAEDTWALAQLLMRAGKIMWVLKLAYRALTEGMANVPAEERDPRCAKLRAEAKREIRRVLGMVDADAEAK